MSARHAAGTCAPERHAARGNRVWDAQFHCWRCCSCGHRAETDGKAPRQTRYMWPWLWRRELARREWARTVRLPVPRPGDSDDA